MDGMLETMHKNHGIGLAAVQVGALKNNKNSEDRVCNDLELVFNKVDEKCISEIRRFSDQISKDIAKTQDAIADNKQRITQHTRIYSLFFFAFCNP